jgi:hypothetical protein
MKIGFIGGAETDLEKIAIKQREDFVKACQWLACTVFSFGHSIVVGNEDPMSADASAVEGIMRALEAEAKSQEIAKPQEIIVVKPGSESVPFEKYRRGPHSLLFADRPAASDLDTMKMQIIRECDGVLVLGGGKASRLAGLAAAISGKRVVPVGTFGGAGEELIDRFRSESWGDRVPSEYHLRRLRSPWSEPLGDMIVQALGAAPTPPRVLIVHGHSDDFRMVEESLRTMAAEPVAMVDQYGGSRTMKEKFESLASEVDGAIVIATPDDVGGQQQKLLPRARQNVWLEFGWFWGRLGLDRVLLLTKGDVELPSDAPIEHYVYSGQPTEARASQATRTFIDRLRQTPKRAFKFTAGGL